MARSKPAGKQIPAALSDGAVTDIAPEEVFDSELMAIENIIREHGEVSRAVRVFREGPGGYHDLTFLFPITPQEWLETGLQKLQAEYGTGKYRIHLQDASGAFLVNKGIKVEGIKRPDAPLAPAAPAAPAIDIKEIALTIAQTIAQTLQPILVHLAAPRDPMQTLDGIKQIAEMFKAAPVPPPASPLEGLKDAFGLMKLMREAMPGPGIGDGEGKTSTFDYAMQKGLDMLSTAVSTGMLTIGKNPGVAAKVAENVQLPPAATAAPATPAAPVAQTQEEKEIEEMNVFVRMQLRMANSRAASGADPKDFAEEVYNLIPEEIVTGMAIDADWFSALVAQVPECAQHQAWFAKIRDSFIEFAIEDGLLVRGTDNALTLAPEPGKESESAPPAVNDAKPASTPESPA
jgi:hypothetical protein